MITGILGLLVFLVVLIVIVALVDALLRAIGVDPAYLRAIRIALLVILLIVLILWFFGGVPVPGIRYR